MSGAGAPNNNKELISKLNKSLWKIPTFLLRINGVKYSSCLESIVYTKDEAAKDASVTALTDAMDAVTTGTTPIKLTDHIDYEVFGTNSFPDFVIKKDGKHATTFKSGNTFDNISKELTGKKRNDILLNVELKTTLGNWSGTEAISAQYFNSIFDTDWNDSAGKTERAQRFFDYAVKTKILFAKTRDANTQIGMNTYRLPDNLLYGSTYQYIVNDDPDSKLKTKADIRSAGKFTTNDITVNRNLELRNTLPRGNRAVHLDRIKADLQQFYVMLKVNSLLPDKPTGYKKNSSRPIDTAYKQVKSQAKSAINRASYRAEFNNEIWRQIETQVGDYYDIGALRPWLKDYCEESRSNPGEKRAFRQTLLLSQLTVPLMAGINETYDIPSISRGLGQLISRNRGLQQLFTLNGNELRLNLFNAASLDSAFAILRGADAFKFIRSTNSVFTQKQILGENLLPLVPRENIADAETGVREQFESAEQVVAALPSALDDARETTREATREAARELADEAFAFAEEIRRQERQRDVEMFKRLHIGSTELSQDAIRELEERVNTLIEENTRLREANRLLLAKNAQLVGGLSLVGDQPSPPPRPPIELPTYEVIQRLSSNSLLQPVATAVMFNEPIELTAEQISLLHEYGLSRESVERARVQTAEATPVTVYSPQIVQAASVPHEGQIPIGGEIIQIDGDSSEDNTDIVDFALAGDNALALVQRETSP